MATKNYAAQVMKALDETQGFINKNNEEEVNNIASLKEMLGVAVHFSLPDDGVVLDSSLKGLKGEQARLPYPIVTVEYITHYRNATVRTLVLSAEFTTEDKDEEVSIGCAVFYHMDDKSGWAICPISFEVSSRWESNMKGSLIVADSHLIFPGILTKIERKLKILEELGYYKNYEKLDAYDRVCRQFSSGVRSILELCEALSCTNIDQRIDQRESSSNPKRIRKGKLPILETRTLVINATGTKGTREGYKIEGERSSPRQHLRRGHFRFLRPLEGEEKRRKTWVRSCVVGADGKIDKEYEIR